MIDLLKYSSTGGCSAKIPQDKLMDILSNLQPLKDNNILVDITTSDDAGVYKINDNLALIVTTDFFPAICSDPYEFGQVAAANSLSDVYAMGGTPLLVLNLNMFPSATMPLEVLGEIMRGGQDKINEAGAFVMGGHTIEDATVKYGLAVVGTVHPNRVATNNGAKVGQKLILTKPLGIGVLVAAHRLEMVSKESYQMAIEQMKSLNKEACSVMNKFNVTAATDITGFGLIGHLNKMAQGSNLSIQIECNSLPILPEVEMIINQGCVPATALRNLKSVGEDAIFTTNVTMSHKMVCCDAQTSGGILMAVNEDIANDALIMLKERGCRDSVIVGEVVSKREKNLYFY